MLRKLVTAFVLILAMGPAHADYASRSEAVALADELAEEGLDRARVLELLGSAERKESILEAIARPAEKTLTWAEYRNIFVQESRITQGLAFWQEHEELLSRINREFGVPAHMVLAILGVETRYGRHKGNFRVVDALATLGFDYPPRSKFFRSQLKELFRLEKEAHIDAGSITGSYAGAMGYPQFIPSSYIHYAVDYDDDGVTDLVNNPVDAMASVANYFSEHGWEPGLPVAARARLSGSAWTALVQDKPKPATTLREASLAGAVPVTCEESRYCFADLPAETPVALLEFEGPNGREYWLATNNFYVITRYNHSNLYGLAAFQLGEELLSRRSQ